MLLCVKASRVYQLAVDQNHEGSYLSRVVYSVSIFNRSVTEGAEHLVVNTRLIW